MKKHTLIALLLTALAVPGLAGAAGTAPETAARQARVAGGGKVELAASAQSAEQWSAQRPKFRALRPRARSNAE